MSDTQRASAHGLRWLVAGAIAGAAIAATTLVRGGAPNAVGPGAGISSEVVAMVNGQPVTRDALARFTGAIARERGRLDLDPAEQRRVLDRLVDEELLLQRGVALGLERSEPSARRAIVSAVIDTLTTAEMREPDRSDLEAFYRDHGKTLARAGAVQVELAFVPVGAIAEEDAKRRANEIASRARGGESLAALAVSLGQALDPPLPAGPTNFDALRDRVGNVVVQALARLEPGAISEPARAMDGYWVGRVITREPDVVPPLGEVVEAVQQAWVKREHDAALAREIERLREQSDVVITDATLAGAR